MYLQLKMTFLQSNFFSISNLWGNEIECIRSVLRAVFEHLSIGLLVFCYGIGFWDLIELIMLLNKLIIVSLVAYIAFMKVLNLCAVGLTLFELILI